MNEDARRRFVECAFFVLELQPDASRADVERAAQRLTAELAVGRASASSYRTPFGRVERSADRVRAAASALRDPSTRLAHEIVARAAAMDLREEAPSTFAWGDWIAHFGLGGPPR